MHTAYAYLYRCIIYCTIVVQLFYIIEIYENVGIISIRITVLTMTGIHLIKIPYYFISLVTTAYSRYTYIMCNVTLRYNTLIRDFVLTHRLILSFQIY